MNAVFTAPEPTLTSIVVDGRDYTRDVVRVLERRQAADFQRAERELAAAHRAGGERYFIQGENGKAVGAVDMIFHPVHIGPLLNKFGGDHKCLEDKSVQRDYLKQFPAAKVRSRSRKIQVGFTGGTTRFGARITFRKTY